MKIRKLLTCVAVIAMALTMAFVVTACGNDPAPAPTPAPTPTPTPTPAPTPTPVADPVDYDDYYYYYYYDDYYFDDYYYDDDFGFEVDLDEIVLAVGGFLDDGSIAYFMFDVNQYGTLLVGDGEAWELLMGPLEYLGDENYYALHCSLTGTVLEIFIDDFGGGVYGFVLLDHDLEGEFEEVDPAYVAELVLHVMVSAGLL
ncbi:MAG: hypothetical protein FWC13_12840 [Oscillospiraceae bacterium]|nr:hypothetical protein [Oscillospiraceae bacterium]